MLLCCTSSSLDSLQEGVHAVGALEGQQSAADIPADRPAMGEGWWGVRSNEQQAINIQYAPVAGENGGGWWH